MTIGVKGDTRLYNSLTRRLEPVQPIDPPRLRIYACGPTVYDHPHLGNFRTFVWVDVLTRMLTWRGYDVTLVMNITDVDDRIIDGAQRSGQSIDQLTEPYRRAFEDGLRALGIRTASAYPRATLHVEEMIRLVSVLLQRGHAYRSDDGSVFFDVASFPRYGQLARLDPEEMLATSRVEGDEFGKRDPRDFALWKAAKPGEPAWTAPFGSGRPGWHLECSAMSMHLLGDTFDMHLGGADLMFPHHENEIAQSEAATGTPLARMWLHCSHLVVNGTKMSKSLGNFVTLPDLLARGYDPTAIRYLLASVHYRRQLNFTDDGLAQAAAAVGRLRDFAQRAESALSRLPASAAPGSTLAAALGAARDGFGAALDDDLNTSGALGHLFTLVREANSALDGGTADAETVGEALAWLRDIDAVLNLLPITKLRELSVDTGGRTLRATGPALGEELEAIIIARLRARAARDFAAADRLRDQLAAAGIVLEDTADGVRWKRFSRGVA